ncbi:MAG: DinB family protein, partial [Pseudomonadota bacterium]|nr:DinB family protein [Pseudomonadota bacterium]
MLSLAAIDVRNRSLAWAALFEAALDRPMPRTTFDVEPERATRPPLWRLGHIAWFQEFWIGRNVQRGRGERADRCLPRLASILPDADRWYDPALDDGAANAQPAPDDSPDFAATRLYLIESLESSLELLDATRDETDDALYFHRLALFHEELQVEGFAVLAQTLGIALPAGFLPRIATQASRPALLFPATRWLLGTSAPGFRFDNEREPHLVAIPEFEIDAQAVTWAQFGEFVEDGGYDEPAHWSEAGWAWVTRRGRRTPRHVDQLRHGVLQH